jgi:C1A family cysteine protease
LQYLGDKKEDDIKIFFENLAKTEEGSTQRPYYVYLTQLAINLLRLSSNLDWLNNSSKEIKLIQGILENLKNYFDILERFNFASKQSEPLPIKGLMETLVEKIEILLSFDSSTNSKKPSEQDFKDIIQEIYKLNIPQIPPQFFERKEIILEMPIHIDLFKIILEHLTGKVGKKMVVTFNTDNPEEPTIRRTKSHVWVDVPFSLDKYLSKDDCLSRQLYALVNPIVHIVAEILMPLGFGSKLSDSVEKALQKIENLLSEKNNLQSEEIQRKEEIRKLMSEALEQQGGALPKDVSSNVDDLRLLDMATSTLQKISSNLSQYMDYGWKFNAENSNCKDIVQESNWYFLSGDCRLVSLIEKIKKIEENNEKIEENQRLLLKPEQPIFQYVSKGNASNSHKQIQFPIGQELREKIANLQAKSKSPAIPSSYTEEVKQDKCVPDPNNVYLALPRFVDLSYCFSPVEDQGSLNSCTAHAGISLIEYAQYKITGTYTDVSPLFLYKVTRNLMKKEGDSGASMRDTMKAMVAFGVCPEEHWNYNEADFDQEPDAFCYSFAESFKALKYFRLDYGTISKSTLLAQVKVLLASEIPCAFGFTLYSSVYEDSNFELGHIPLPTSRDKVVGGHVVVAVGYHDRKIIKKSNGDQFEGALLIRNSWGSRWGQGGYGWMPYEYVTKGLTADWWSLLKAEWLASGSFGAGASAWDRDKGGDGRHQ